MAPLAQPGRRGSTGGSTRDQERRLCLSVSHDGTSSRFDCKPQAEPPHAPLAQISRIAANRRDAPTGQERTGVSSARAPLDCLG